MVKIDYVSDLHANHWMLWIPNQLKWENRTRALTRRLIEKGHGEVLVIAGDFGEWNCQAFWILDEASKHYERVYFTHGNHDLYLLTKRQKKKYGDSLGRLQDLIESVSVLPNVVPLVKTVDQFKGVTFAGDAMWYHPHTEKDWHMYRENLHDSDDIKIRGVFRDDIPLKLYHEAIEWYQSLKHTPIDCFVSHVPPVHNPFSPFEPNGCYYGAVPYFNATNWICGHEHLQKEFQMNGVQFRMNAIGYPQHYSNYPRSRNVLPAENVDEYKKFGIKTFEV